MLGHQLRVILSIVEELLIGQLEVDGYSAISLLIRAVEV
jgi:hypothetical protein